MKFTFAAVPLAALTLMASTALAAEPSNKTEDFIEQATIGGMYEIESSKLALNKSVNANVKKFAQSMIDDHKAADEKLKAAIDKSGLTNVKVPTALDADHQEEIDELAQKSEAEFDDEYIDDQVDAHQKTISLFEEYAKDGDNEALKQFASDTLPTLKEHKAHIDTLDKEATN